MHYIFIDKLKVFAHHGVFPEETREGQDFYISAQLYLDTTKAAKDDDLSKSVNYGEVCHFITKLMKEKTFLLIESAADYLAKELLLAYPLLWKVSLNLYKPHAPIGLPFENVGIHTERAWHEVYLSIGSNLGDKKGYLDFAVDKLKENPFCRLGKISDYIVTKPYGNTRQDDFLNGAIQLKTLYSPWELLDFLHEIEASAGRERLIHWGPRTLDLDILLYDSLITEEDDLVIPHPDMLNRDFVLVPLKQIAPNKIHPLIQKRIRDIEQS